MRLPFIMRAVSCLLIITFLSQDIVWACPDNLFPGSSQNTKLAPQSLFAESESADRVYGKVIEQYIEGNGIPRDRLTLLAVKAAINKHKSEKWFKDNVTLAEYGGEILISFGSGFILRYYDPTALSPEEQRKYEARAVNGPGLHASIILNPYLHKELLKAEAPSAPQGAAIVADKMRMAALISPASALVLGAVAFHYQSVFVYAVLICYMIYTGILPDLLGKRIDRALSYGRDASGKKADHGLIAPFKDAEDIHLIEDRVDGRDAKGKLSYYSYTFEQKIRSGQTDEIKTALFVDKAALRSMPRFYQWLVYLHEWIHLRLRINIEPVAVPLTFCGPWLVLNIIVMGGAGWFLPPHDLFFLAALAVYNAALPVAMWAFSGIYGVSESPAGHRLLGLAWKHLDDGEIDGLIKRHVYEDTRKADTHEMEDWGDWLKGAAGASSVELIHCPDRPDDILVVKGSHTPGIDSSSTAIQECLARSDKRSFVLIIADRESAGLSREERRQRVEAISKEADSAMAAVFPRKIFGVMPSRRIIKRDVRSTSFDITGLRELELFDRRRLARLEHADLEREVVVSEVHGHVDRLRVVLEWIVRTRQRNVTFIGDYIGKAVGEDGLEALDLLMEYADRIPNLKMLIGRTEHIFLRAMLGDDDSTDIWPYNSQVGGPNVRLSLKILSERGDPETLAFELLIGRIAKKNHTKYEDEWKKYWRFHPKLMRIADFMAERMNFVFSEDKHHNVCMVMGIPKDLKWRGLKGMEALRLMEDEFRDKTQFGLWLMKVIRKIWVLAETTDGNDEAKKKAITEMIRKERDADRIGAVSIGAAAWEGLTRARVLDEMETILGEAKEEEALDVIFDHLFDSLKKGTRPLPEIFNLVMPRGKDARRLLPLSPFFVTSPGGLETPHSTEKEKQERRLELAVNTVITLGDFNVDAQSLGQVRVLENTGAVRLLAVDSLKPGADISAGAVDVLVARIRDEYARQQRNASGTPKIGKDGRDIIDVIWSLERVVTRKLDGDPRIGFRGISEIVAEYGYISEGVRETPAMRRVNEIWHYAVSPLFARDKRAAGDAAYMRKPASPDMAGPQESVKFEDPLLRVILHDLKNKLMALSYCELIMSYAANAPESPGKDADLKPMKEYGGIFKKLGDATIGYFQGKCGLEDTVRALNDNMADMVRITGEISERLSSGGYGWNPEARLMTESLVSHVSKAVIPLVHGAVNWLDRSMTAVDVEGLLTEAVSIARATKVLLPDVDVKIKISDDVRNAGTLSTYRLILSMAVQELLLNAAKYSKSDRIEITASIRAPGELEIGVRDYGDGIKPEDLEKVFRPGFTSAPNSRTGTGFGLPSLKEAIDSVGGSIAAQSEYGRGAIFRLTIPADAPLDRMPRPRLGSPVIVAVSGLAGSGRGTISQWLAAKLGLCYINRGDIARVTVMELLERNAAGGNIDAGNEALVTLFVRKFLMSGRLSYSGPSLLFDGKNLYAAEASDGIAPRDNIRGIIDKNRGNSDLLHKIFSYAGVREALEEFVESQAARIKASGKYNGIVMRLTDPVTDRPGVINIMLDAPAGIRAQRAKTQVDRIETLDVMTGRTVMTSKFPGVYTLDTTAISRNVAEDALRYVVSRLPLNDRLKVGSDGAASAAEPAREYLRYPEPRDPHLELDEYDRGHYYWDAQTRYWRSKTHNKLVLGTYEDVVRSNAEGAAPTDMENHVAIRTKAGFSIYVFDVHSYSRDYLTEAEERGELSRNGNGQIFIDDHPDTFAAADPDASVASDIATDGWVSSHHWVYMEEENLWHRGKEILEPDRSLTALRVSNTCCHFSRYFELKRRPRGKKAIFNIDSDATADPAKILAFIKDIRDRDGVTPSTIHISTSPPNLVDKYDTAYSDVDGFFYPDGFGSVDTCRTLAMETGLMSFFPEDPSEEKPVYKPGTPEINIEIAGDGIGPLPGGANAGSESPKERLEEKLAALVAIAENHDGPVVLDGETLKRLEMPYDEAESLAEFANKEWEALGSNRRLMPDRLTGTIRLAFSGTGSEIFTEEEKDLWKGLRPGGDADVNSRIRNYIEKGRAVEIREDRSVVRIRRNRSNPTSPSLEDIFASDGILENISRSKDPALLGKVLENASNFSSYNAEERERLIREAQKVTMSVILGEAYIYERMTGEGEFRRVLTHVRQGFTKKVHGLEPTVWIGEKLLDALTPEQIARVLLEECQHLVRPYDFKGRDTGGRMIWSGMHDTEMGRDADPRTVVAHDRDFVKSLQAIVIARDASPQAARPQDRRNAKAVLLVDYHGRSGGMWEGDIRSVFPDAEVITVRGLAEALAALKKMGSDICAVVTNLHYDDERELVDMTDREKWLESAAMIMYDMRTRGRSVPMLIYTNSGIVSTILWRLKIWREFGKLIRFKILRRPDRDGMLDGLRKLREWADSGEPIKPGSPDMAGQAENGSGATRDKKLKAESVYKDYFETIFEFNLQLFVLLARRMKARRASDYAALETTRAEMEECLADLDREISEFEARLAGLPVNMRMADAHRAAKEKFALAKSLIDRNNESAANAALVAALNAVSRAREEILHLRISSHRVRINVYKKYGNLVMRQHVYVKAEEGAKTLVPMYVEKKFGLRWQAGRSLDDQEDGIMNERRKISEWLAKIDEDQARAERGTAFSADNTGEILSNLTGVLVEEKRLGRITLEAVKELMELDQTGSVKYLLPIARRYLGIRVEDIDRMLYYLKIGRIDPFRSIVNRDNADLIASAKRIEDLLKAGRYREARGSAYGLMKKAEPFFAEPDLEGFSTVLGPVLGDTLKPLKIAGTPGENVTKARALFWAALARKKLEDSQRLSEFMEVFRTEYVTRRLRGEAPYIKEDTFVDVFESFIKAKQLIRGSPQAKSFQILCYLASFISMENPAFNAINTMRLLVEIDDIGAILRTKRLQKYSATLAALKDLSGKAYIGKLDLSDRTRLLKAITVDFKLDDAGRFELAKALAINKKNLHEALPVELVKPGSPDMASGPEIDAKAAGKGRTVDVELVNVAGLTLPIVTKEEIDPDAVKPQEVVIPDAAGISEAEKAADEAMRQGRVAVITVAGGMSSRAGIEYPKGMHPISPLSEKTLFEKRAEEIRAFGLRYGKPILWYLMTSDVTDGPTRKYFAEKDYFGLGRENVIFIRQKNVPAFEAGTRTPAMKSAGEVFTAPNGHGGLYEAMRDAAARTDGSDMSGIATAEARGVDVFMMTNVDNAMPVIDRTVLGYHVRRQSGFTSVLLRKRDPKEGLAMAVEDSSGDRFFVEYNQPVAEILRERPGYGFGSINRLVFSREFLAATPQPPYRLAAGKEAAIFKDGVQKKGLVDKLESFVFEQQGMAGRVLNIASNRDECFAAFKKMEGPDSPATVAKAMSELDKKRLWASGRASDVSEESTLELSFAFATSPSDIAAKVDGGLVIDGNASVYLGGRDIKIGKNVRIDGAALRIEFEDPYDGSFKMPDNVSIGPGEEVRIYVKKGERAVYRPERSGLAALHGLFTTGLGGKHMDDGKRILLSENLFVKDGDDSDLVKIRVALGSLLQNGQVAIMKPHEIRRAAMNRDVTKEKMAIVLTKEDFDDSRVWNGSDRQTSLRSSVIILDDRMTGNNYLYLEGVLGLARAVMARNRQAIKEYYRLITGVVVDDKVLELIKDDDQNNVAFAVKAMLKFRPIGMIVDSEEFNKARLAMENALIAA